MAYEYFSKQNKTNINLIEKQKHINFAFLLLLNDVIYQIIKVILYLNVTFQEIINYIHLYKSSWDHYLHVLSVKILRTLPQANFEMAEIVCFPGAFPIHNKTNNRKLTW